MESALAVDVPEDAGGEGRETLSLLFAFDDGNDDDDAADGLVEESSSTTMATTAVLLLLLLSVDVDVDGDSSLAFAMDGVRGGRGKGGKKREISEGSSLRRTISDGAGRRNLNPTKPPPGRRRRTHPPHPSRGSRDPTNEKPIRTQSACNSMARILNLGARSITDSAPPSPCVASGAPPIALSDSRRYSLRAWTPGTS